MTCTPSHPTAEVRRQHRAERNLLAGFPWRLFALAVLTIIVATVLTAVAATHITQRALLTADRAVERAKY